MIKLKIVSPLDKFFPDDDIALAREFSPAPVFAGETFSFHVLYADGGASYLKTPVRVSVTTDLDGADLKIYKIEHVPVRTPCYPDSHDDGYISTKPGLYPDVMTEIDGTSPLYAPQVGMNMLRIELAVPVTAGGKYGVKVTVRSDDLSQTVGAEVSFEVLPVCLPRQKTVVIQWMHTDCIAQYYGITPMTDKYFEYVEKFVRRAVENGINALLTPVFTPPLDTAVGGERLTVQLVDVYKDGGKWSFSYENLDRWIDMALRCGVEYFEIAHLFTQWGARHAPKIIATVDGEVKKVFGWDTDAGSDEYVSFLNEFLSALIAHMKSRGLDKKCIFHISDEPQASDEESYRRAVESVRGVLDGYTVADAISETKYYENGLCRCPIPGIDSAKNFLPLIPEGLWVYYCCGQSVNVSNRFIALPLARVRIIGFQMWKYKIGGFLHWGYNFWNSQNSRYPIDPYRITDGDYFAPAGDAFSVYPGRDGEAVPSLRIRAFYEALCDVRALEAAEEKCGREAVLDAIEGGLGHELTFEKYPREAEYIFDVRRKIAEMMK